MERLLTSKEVKQLFGIKSDTTLIEYEKSGLIRIHSRIGNRKRYCPKYIQRKLGQ